MSSFTHTHAFECQLLFWSILTLPPSHLTYSILQYIMAVVRLKKKTSLFPLCYPATFAKRPGRMAHSIALFIEINQVHLSFTQSHKTHLTFHWFSECQSEQQPCRSLCCFAHGLKDFESVRRRHLDSDDEERQRSLCIDRPIFVFTGDSFCW